MVQVEVQYLLQELSESMMEFPLPPHVLLRGDSGMHMISHPKYRTVLPLLRVSAPFLRQAQYLQNEPTILITESGWGHMSSV